MQSPYHDVRPEGDEPHEGLLRQQLQHLVIEIWGKEEWG